MTGLFSDLLPIVVSIDDMIDEARREVKMRERVYEGLIASGKMKRETAATRIGVMMAIVQELERARARGRETT